MQMILRGGGVQMLKDAGIIEYLCAMDKVSVKTQRKLWTKNGGLLVEIERVMRIETIGRASPTPKGSLQQ